VTGTSAPSISVTTAGSEANRLGKKSTREAELSIAIRRDTEYLRVGFGKKEFFFALTPSFRIGVTLRAFTHGHERNREGKPLVNRPSQSKAAGL